MDLPLRPLSSLCVLCVKDFAFHGLRAARSRAGAAWIGVANCTRGRAEELVQEFDAAQPGTALAHFSLDPAELAAAPRGGDLLGNTSTVGLRG